MAKTLLKAKKRKNDEFYTQLTDIEKELRHYRPHFDGKAVYCNCDDPRVSNFFYYFSYNFRKLNLRKLVTTCYRNQNPDLFSRHDTDRAIKLEYDGFRDGDNVPRPDDTDIIPLEGDGDFRSSECVELLKKADIVVTNPPFSLFREYVSQLVKYEKKFLIIGDKNAPSYKDMFNLFKERRIWIGNASMSQDMLFDVPDDEAKRLLETEKEGSAYKRVGGKIKARAKAVWFTNMDFPKRHEDMVLYRHYDPDDYPRYDNYDAINVDRVADIPIDYDGAMGVPITFLDKHNPDQFEILDANGIRANDRVPVKGHGLIKDKEGAVHGRPKFARIVIRNRRPETAG